MIIRKSFLIRWLLNPGDERQPEHSVIDVKHIQTGSSCRVSSLEEVSQWMKDAEADQDEESAEE